MGYFAAALIGIAVGMLAGGAMLAGYLESKGQAGPSRTAARIGGGFYYIVPEHEYVEMQAAARRGGDRHW